MRIEWLVRNSAISLSLQLTCLQNVGMSLISPVAEYSSGYPRNIALWQQFEMNYLELKTGYQVEFTSRVYIMLKVTFSCFTGLAVATVPPDSWPHVPLLFPG